MKKTITVFALLAGAVAGYAQGTILLSDYISSPSPFCIDVFSPQLNNLTVQMTGNTSVDLPVGTVGIGTANGYEGVPLGGSSGGAISWTNYANGALWTVALYAAPGVNNLSGLAAAEAAGVPVMTSLYQTSGGIGIANAGTAGNNSAGVWAYGIYTTSATALPSGFTGGATLQLEVWYNGGVTNPANFGAQEAASLVSGLSAIESIAALGGTGSPQAPVPDLGNFVPGDGQITSFSLTSQEVPPSITSQPQSLTVNITDTASFSVTATGSLLTYQWLENNLSLAGQTNSTLVLTNVSLTNAAQYAVVVSNAVGVVTSVPAILTVEADPIILAQPQSQSVWGGTSVTFSVDVAGGSGAGATLPTVGSGTLQLWLRADLGVITNSGGQVSQWQDQSGNGNNAGQSKTNQQPVVAYPAAIGGMPSVRFSGIQTSSQGEYLYGSGLVGVPNALTAFMLYEMNSAAIAGQLPLFIGVPGTYGASRGNFMASGDMRFTTWTYDYQTAFLIPTNTYRVWTDRFNTNENLIELFDDTLQASTNFSLATSGQSAPGAGYYIGGLNTSAPSVSSGLNFGGDIAEIIVYQGALSDPDRLAVVNYLEQKYATTNGLAMSFQWLFDGTNLAGATNAFLSFTNVQGSQAGTYSVVVSNPYGATTSSNAVLQVNLIPIILTQPVSQLFLSNQSITLSVQAEGPVPLQYQWTFNGTNLIGATNSTLFFSNTLPSEAGTYAVVLGTAPNVTVSSNAVLTLVPPNEVVSNLDAGKLNIALQAGGTVTFAIDGIIVLTNTILLSNNVTLDGTNHSITISGGGTVQIFNISGGQITLRNLTLANGMNYASIVYYGMTIEEPSYGGAIFTQGTLNVENCTFTNNHAPGGSMFETSGTSGWGGAIYNEGGLSITNSVFVNNSAYGATGYGNSYASGGSGLGGAICNVGGNITLGNVSFSNNSTTGGTAGGAAYNNTCGGGAGGALYGSGGSIQANNLQVFNNSANGGGVSGNSPYYTPISGGIALGGAFYFTGCAAAISNSVFSNNVANGGTGGEGGVAGMSQGGCIYSSGAAIFWQCNLVGSRAQGGPGGLYYGYSSSSFGMGGAIYNSGTMQIAGSTISNSIASGGFLYEPSSPTDGYGGAVYNTGSLEIESATLAGNSAVGGSGAVGPFAPAGNGWGGAIYNKGGVKIAGSILSGNGAAGGSAYPSAGNAWGGAIYNAGFVQFSSTILSNDITSGTSNFGVEIFSVGAIQSDAYSTLIPYVTGTPPLTYQWQMNSNNIAGDTNSTFDLGNVQFTNLGTYNLVISNGSGLVTNFEEIVNQPLPPLTISSVTPNIGVPGGATRVTITGTGFTNGATVYFGNATATSVVVASATSIAANTPPATTFGAVNVVVTNGGDFQPVVFANGFTYLAPLQNLSASLNPGQGALLQFTGTPGYTYVLLVTANLTPPIYWRPVATNLADTNGNWAFLDTNAMASPVLFYRAVLVGP